MITQQVVKQEIEFKIDERDLKWREPKIIVEGFWNHMLEAEDSVMCIHAWEENDEKINRNGSEFAFYNELKENIDIATSIKKSANLMMVIGTYSGRCLLY